MIAVEPLAGASAGPLAINLLTTAAVTMGVMIATFCYARAKDRYRTVDVVWGVAFAVVAVVGLGLSAGHGDPGRRFLVTALTVVWGLRLALHIGLRARGAPEDPRYAAMLARAPGRRSWYAFTKIYLLQGALVWFVSLPVQVAQYEKGALGPIAAAGCALWLFGFCFEAIGDWQLVRFKADPANRGTLLQTGLRRYTRSPNYFGDACVWWGLFAIAADQPVGLLTVLSPVVMNWLLAYGSGRPLMERHLAATRPDYARYAAHTSRFLPRRPTR